MDAVAAKKEEENGVIPSSNRFTQFVYSIIAGLSGLVIGTAVGWNSPATELLSAMDNTAAATDDDQVVWKAASYYCLGTVVGGLIQRPLAKCIGHRWSMAVYDVVAMIGWLALLRPVYDWPWSVALARFIQGLGTGGLGLLTPTYISHITNVDVRGRAHMFHQAFVCFGIFYSYVFGTITTNQVLISMCMIWPVFHLLITVSFMPESPCVLYTRNNRETLRTVMCQIKGIEYDVHSDYKELKKYMGGSFESSSCDFASTNNAVLKNHGCNVFIIGLGLVMFQQLCGVNLCIFHMEHIFNELRLVDDTFMKAQVIVMGVALAQVLICLMSIELVEFLGRKCMLITSAAGMCLSMSMLYYVLLTYDVVHEGTEWRNNIIVIIVISYVCSYSIGWGPVVMLLYTEIVHFDKWYSSLIYASGQLVVFVMMYTFSDAHALKGTYIACTSIVLCVVSIAFVCYFVPETRGLHLNQIQSVLDNRVRERADVRLQQVKVVK